MSAVGQGDAMGSSLWLLAVTLAVYGGKVSLLYNDERNNGASSGEAVVMSAHVAADNFADMMLWNRSSAYHWNASLSSRRRKADYRRGDFRDIAERRASIMMRIAGELRLFD